MKKNMFSSLPEIDKVRNVLINLHILSYFCGLNNL